MQELFKLISQKVYAEDVFKPTAAGLGLNATITVQKLVTTVVTGLIGFAGLLFFIMLVVGGIQYVLSGGDKTGAQAAKDRITHALIGIVIVAAAWAIVTLLQTITGFNATNFELTPIT